jgi:hypothetical protein
VRVVLFFAGRKKYTIINAHENVIGKMASCIGVGVKVTKYHAPVFCVISLKRNEMHANQITY